VTEWTPRHWETVAATPLARANCFYVAGLLAQREGLRYVEGVASLLPGMPSQHHAWVVDASDRVLEPTLPWPALGYYGVV
jgi:hypothetical protein